MSEQTSAEVGVRSSEQVYSQVFTGRHCPPSLTVHLCSGGGGGVSCPSATVYVCARLPGATVRFPAILSPLPALSAAVAAAVAAIIVLHPSVFVCARVPFTEEWETAARGSFEGGRGATEEREREKTREAQRQDEYVALDAPTEHTRVVLSLSLSLCKGQQWKAHRRSERSQSRSVCLSLFILSFNQATIFLAASRVSEGGDRSRQVSTSTGGKNIHTTTTTSSAAKLRQAVTNCRLLHFVSAVEAGSSSGSSRSKNSGSEHQ